MAGGSSPLQPRPEVELMRSILPPKQPESRILLGPWRTWLRGPRPAAEAACLASPAALELRPCGRGSGAVCSSCSARTVPGRRSSGSCNGREEPAPQDPSPEPNHPRGCLSEPTPWAQGPGSQSRHFLILSRRRPVHFGCPVSSPDAFMQPCTAHLGSGPFQVGAWARATQRV